jgi:hypothetical protein
MNLTDVAGVKTPNIHTFLHGECIERNTRHALNYLHCSSTKEKANLFFETQIGTTQIGPTTLKRAPQGEPQCGS